MRRVRAPQRFVYTASVGFNIGGRKTPEGFSRPFDKGMQVKQNTREGVPRRIPGTTKIQYTNAKGRTFNFSIPVSEITHPSVPLESASGRGWKEIDTSFCDVGDLEEDMPTEIDELLRKASVPSSGDGELDSLVTVEMDRSSLEELRASFVKLCRDYVLMDVDGMKSNMTYSELNNGPDYEMFDRKSARTRHWLAIRHRFEDIKEILWPLEEDLSEDTPRLSSEEMLEALNWLEAASTFAVRKHHPYHHVSKDDFTSLSLSREVRALLQAMRAEGKGDDWLASSKDQIRAQSERFISCAALCATHDVSLSVLFPLSTDSLEFFFHLPPPASVGDAIRVMGILNKLEDSSHTFCFSDTTGNVVCEKRLELFSKLCSPRLFAESDALKHVDDSQLCVLMTFVVHLQEQNRMFFKQAPEEWKTAHSYFQRVTQAAVARCKYLLYQLGGPQSTIMSEDEYIPFIEAQEFAEKSHKDVFVHGKIGMENAQGLRRASLGTQSSTTLMGLLQRLEETGDTFPVSHLVEDLMQHIALRAAHGKGGLSLPDITQLLPLLSRLMELLSEDQVKRKHDRLFSSIGHSIAVELQAETSSETIVALLEGLAACRYVPSSFQQIQMVLMRKILAEQTTVSQLSRVLVSLLRLVGHDGIPPAVVQCCGQIVLQQLKQEKESGVKTSTTAVGDYLNLLRVMKSCKYPFFMELLDQIFRKELLSADQLDTPLERCTFALLEAYHTASQDSASPEMFDRARQLLDEGLRQWTTMATTEERDVLTDALVASCVLNLERSDILERFVETDHLHSLLSPMQGAVVLASLETLGLEGSTLYATYVDYIQRYLTALESLTTPLSKEDSDCLIQVLQLQSMSADVAKRAGLLLATEMKRLDEEGAPNDGSLYPSGEASQLAERERRAKAGEKALAFLSRLTE